MSLILSGTDGLSDVDGSAATPAIRGSDTNTGMFFPAADTIAFSEGGVESMRLDSAGNLGLGTSTPVSRLRLKQKPTNGFTDGFSMQRHDTADTYEWVVGGDNGLYLGYANNASGADAPGDFSTRMVIDSSGRLIVPGQPTVFAQRTAGSITSGVIVFNDVLLNVGNNYSAANGRFTAPVSGVYAVTCHGIIGNNGSMASGDLYIRRNGSPYASAHNNHTDIWDNSSIHGLVQCSAGDFIEVTYTQGATGTVFYGANPSSSAYNGLCIQLVC